MKKIDLNNEMNVTMNAELEALIASLGIAPEQAIELRSALSERASAFLPTRDSNGNEYTVGTKLQVRIDNTCELSTIKSGVSTSGKPWSMLALTLANGYEVVVFQGGVNLALRSTTEGLELYKSVVRRVPIGYAPTQAMILACLKKVGKAVVTLEASEKKLATGKTIQYKNWKFKACNIGALDDIVILDGGIEKKEVKKEVKNSKKANK